MSEFACAVLGDSARAVVKAHHCGDANFDLPCERDPLDTDPPLHEGSTTGNSEEAGGDKVDSRLLRHVTSLLSSRRAQLCHHISGWLLEEEQLVRSLLVAGGDASAQNESQLQTVSTASKHHTRRTTVVSGRSAGETVASKELARNNRAAALWGLRQDEKNRSKQSNTHTVFVSESAAGPLAQAWVRFKSWRLRIRSTEPERRGCLARIVTSWSFTMFWMLVILANTALIWYATDDRISNLGSSPNAMFEKLEFGFSVLYIIELTLKVAVYRFHFLFGEDWRWNAFDLLIVAVTFQDQVVSLSSHLQQSRNVGFLRSVRVARVFKVLRIMRLMHHLRELRLILHGILGSLSTLIWSFLLISSVQFIFGVSFVQACTWHLEDIMQNGDLDKERCQQLQQYWGSVWKSIYSLYSASLGGENWRTMAESLSEVSSWLFLTFLAYIGFFNFVVSNTVTSLFVSSATAHTEKDQDCIIADELEHKDNYVKLLRTWFSQLDTDGDGKVSLAEFDARMDAPIVAAFASMLDIDLYDVRQFFRILSQEGRINVDLETFVVGCIRLRGKARSIDLVDLMLSHDRFVLQHEHSSKRCLQALSELRMSIESFAATGQQHLS
eukprot:TRINITY_DN10278_c0_g1_i2.p1 TRINITY_DN10278_c0_g1~~TRINITY_DN10278_c0_g1_i2.p1  ORF type:complete len:610 (+),score=83.19 TRINITY_DN10278_c0_g1_i2:31-1860(+)